MAYTTETRVREEFAFLRADEILTKKTGTTITLSERGFAINEMRKDGTLLVETTDFDFVAPRTITLTGAGAAMATDLYEIVYDTGVPSGTMDNLITKSETIINAKLTAIFAAIPWTSAPALIQEITTELTGCYALRSMAFTTRAVNSSDWWAAAREMKAHIDEMLEAIYRGDIELIGETKSGDTEISVSRGGDKVFDDLEGNEELDWFDHFDTENKEDRNETSDDFNP